MALTGDALGVDLGDLYDAGHYAIPQLSKHFYQSSSALTQINGMDSMLIRDPALGGLRGSAAGSFEELRYAIVDILIKTAQNLDDTGMALVMGAEEYANSDEAAMTKLRSQQQLLDNAADQQAALDQSAGGGN